MVVLLALAGWWCAGGGPVAAGRREPARALVGGSARPAAVPAEAPNAPGAEGEPALRARLAYAQAWAGAEEPALAAFRAWVQRYAGADAAGRAVLEPEGVALARVRRGVMKRLIEREPARALAVTVPADVRALVPAAVAGELEARVAGVGELAWQAICYEDRPRPILAPTSRRVAGLGGETYTASTYGRRAAQPTKEEASLHGIVLDEAMAVHESPLRLLEAAEAAPGEWRLAAQGRTWAVAADAEAVAQIEHRLIEAEALPGPRVPAVDPAGTEPPRALAPPTANTIGAKRLLAIRVDFSDVPGEPVAEGTLTDTLNGAVKRFFEEASYGQTTLTATVSGKVYRMPRTAAAYATANNTSGLHADARALAAADFAVGGYERVMVCFGNLGAGTGGITGSQFGFAGLATVGGTNSWINNAPTMRTIAHELGHNWGLKHSSSWTVTDSNPVSNAGAVLEYGDPWDVMGNHASRDGRHHFNQWCKNQLGWLPDSAVRTVSESGVYRVYRFDSQEAPRTQTQALRVFRDGVRWYWIGYRQNFPATPTLAAGASILWGFNSVQESVLLDCTTPGATPTDAGLALGATLNDTVAGVKVRPVARGGDGPSEWLDVEITLPAAPPDVVAAWGTGENFLDTPNSVSYVPPGTAQIRALASGTSHAVALRANRTVFAWGDATFGQTTVPQINEFVNAVAAGGNVSGAVLADGTVRLWGQGNTGMLTPPEGLADVKQLAIGTTHVVALKQDGTLVGWGSNAAGQLAWPEGLGDIAEVAAGTQTTVLRRRDGTVVALGGTAIRAVPAGLGGVVGLAAGGTHALAVRRDGTVVAWGNNASGQAAVPAGLANVAAVAAGDFHSLALKADGTVVAWGSGTGGKVTVPAGLPRAHTVDASAQGSFALVGPGLFVTAPPEAQTVAAGAPANFSVTAAGTGELTYAWRKNGVELPGATGRTLAIAAAAAADAGDYDVVIRDGTATRTSVVARLGVAAAVVPPVTPPAVAGTGSRIVNLSILTAITAAEPFFTVGAVVGGAGTTGEKPLLVRAAGPALGALGVGTAMADPKLEFFRGRTVIASNDNWGGATVLNNVFTQVGAFAFGTASSGDAAVFPPGLVPDNYTVQVSGVGGSTGTVIAELYDATPAAALTATTPRLINVSVLKPIAAGETLTAGFVIGGTGAKRVLIRAVGPTLGAVPFRLSEAMADPKLDLFSGQTVINTNDNWGDGAALTAAFASVGAFALGAASRDAAILATLQPGNYTAEVSGVRGASGLTLVEVYEVP